MEFEILGDADGGPAIDLDHERFSYAGKFVMTNTGKALVRESGDPVAAIAFDRDRADPGAVRFRYVTVREDRRGEGIAPRLAASLAERLLDSVDRLVIAVNNPFAYEALYKAGFAYAGEQTGLAEVVLERPGDRSAGTYREGLRAFRDRSDLSSAERAFLEERSEGSPPTRVSPLRGASG